MVDISYQNANYDGGNQSTLYKFTREDADRAHGLLVDCGPDLDADALADDAFKAVVPLITHAHVDHIATIGEVAKYTDRIFASEATAAVLEPTLRHDHETNADFVLNKVRSVGAEWTAVFDGVDVRAVPVGHAPGAVGYLVRVRDGEGWVHLFVTGDFTFQHVAGNPGFDPDFGGVLRDVSPGRSHLTMNGGVASEDSFSIGAVELSMPTREAATDELADAISTIVDRVTAGSPTIVATGSLAGVHVASLLDAVQEESDDYFDVILAGKVAAVYDALEYDLPAVRTHTEFDDPAALLDRGQVIIAGPEDASTGSAKRLVEGTRRFDGDATVVQLRSAGRSSLPGSWTTNYEFEYSMHPTAEELDEVVDRINPVHVIVSHTTDKKTLETYRDRGTDLNAYIWASYGDAEYALFSDGLWLSPSWIKDEGLQNVIDTVKDQYVTTTVPGRALPVPAHDPVVLEREGLDAVVERVSGEVAISERALHTTEAVEIDAAVATVAERAATNELHVPGKRIDVADTGALVADAVDAFISDGLAGTLPANATGPTLSASIAVEPDTPLALLLDELDGEAAADETAAAVLASSLKLESTSTATVESPALTPRMPYLRSLLEHPDTDFETPDEVVQAALEHYLGIGPE